MSHYSFCCHDTQFFVLFQLALEHDCQNLVLSLDQFEVLALGELKGGYLIVEHTKVLVHVVPALFDILGYVDLVAKSETSKEFNQHFLILGDRTCQYFFGFIIFVLLYVFELIWKIIE
jgi:hypothetical protein